MGGGVLGRGSLHPEPGAQQLTERPGGGSSLGLSVGGRLGGWMRLEALQAWGRRTGVWALPRKCAEHWPPRRQTGMGLVAIFSRIAGILTPLVMLLGDYHKALPMVIYGSLPMGAGLLCALLPETRGQAMKDTIQDLDQRPPLQ